MEKRYQVFVSSTFEDLREERQEVMQALLELDCIPSGMELFPAANEDQWTIIRKVIDDCDYYIVVVGGRYGSVGPDGKSYTQMEYEYALAKQKPIVAFLREQPEEISAAKTEATEKGRVALEKFRALVKLKTVRTYKNASDLGSVVSRSIVKLIKTNPAVGWIRADESAGSEYAQEILALRKQVEELKTQAARSEREGPPGSKNLAQGNETYSIDFLATYKKGEDALEWMIPKKVRWIDISRFLLPLIQAGASENYIGDSLDDKYLGDIFAKVKKTEKEVSEFSIDIDQDSLRTILFQHQALGLIARSSQSGKSKWVLTTHGERALTMLYAVPSTKGISRS